jgi:hypothetical protein
MFRPLRVIVEAVNDSAHEDETVTLSADRLSIDEHGTLFIQWDGGSQFFGDTTWGRVIVERGVNNQNATAGSRRYR